MTERSPSRSAERRIALGFAVSILLVFVLGALSLFALRRSIQSDRQALDEANALIEFGRLQSAIERKMTAFRGYLLAGKESYLRNIETSRTALRARLAGLAGGTSGEEQKLLERVALTEQEHDTAVQSVIALRQSGASLEAVAESFTGVVEPRREALEAAMASYLDLKRQTVRRAHQASREQNSLASSLILLLGVATIGVSAILAVRLTRRLAHSLATERRERERAEIAANALGESEERKGAILASSLDAVITIDYQGRIVEFNPAAERMFGYSASDVAGREIADLIVPERLRQRHLEGMARYRETGVSKILGERVEMPARRRDGSEFSAELTVRSIRTGREMLFTAFVRDITQSRRAQEERDRLLESERQARARAEAAESRSAFLAEVSEVLGTSLDYRTTLTSVARLAALKVADWCFVDMMEEGDVGRVAVAPRSADHAALARELQERHLLDPRAREGPPHVMATGEAELRLEVPDELLRSIARTPEDYATLARMGIRSYMCVPIRARAHVLGIMTFCVTDSGRRYTVEDLRLAEEIARRAGVAIDNARLYRDAREAVRLRDDFLSIASHELKTPIATLQLQIQSLQRRTRADSDPAVAESLLPRLATAERQVERLSRLVNSLLDISRITAGRFDLERETVDLAAVVREVLARFAEELERAGCSVSLRVDGSPIGLWDRTRIEQIVTNLLTNAAKYGSGRPIDVTLSSDGETTRMVVRDHGIGIAQEHQGRIFGRFERAVSLRHYGGLGLGLWIVRQIVEALGGRISLESQPGEGSEFTVELPQHAASSAAEQASS